MSLSGYALFGLFCFMVGNLMAKIRKNPHRETLIRILDRIDGALDRRRVAVAPGSSLSAECMAELRNHKAINAIKRLRQEEGLSLKDARDRVQYVLADGLEEKVGLIVRELESKP